MEGGAGPPCALTGTPHTTTRQYDTSKPGTYVGNDEHQVPPKFLQAARKYESDGTE